MNIEQRLSCDTVRLIEVWRTVRKLSGLRVPERSRGQHPIDISIEDIRANIATTCSYTPYRSTSWHPDLAGSHAVGLGRGIGQVRRG